MALAILSICYMQIPLGWQHLRYSKNWAFQVAYETSISHSSMLILSSDKQYGNIFTSFNSGLAAGVGPPTMSKVRSFLMLIRRDLGLRLGCLG